MKKYYLEDREFNQFTVFDSETGKLSELEEKEFYSKAVKLRNNDNHLHNKAPQVFIGESSNTHTRFPRRLYFQITRNCNLNCPACFIKASNSGKHVPKEYIYQLADFMGKNGLMEVRLTGGEPTTHPEIINIIRKFQENNVYVSLATNGVFNKKTLVELSEQENIWIICSIDGNRETHNRYRPDTFDKIISNMLFLKSKNPKLRIRINTILTKENKNQIQDLAEICKLLEAESITLIPLRPQVRNKEILEQMVTSEEFRKVIQDLISAKRNHGVNFTTTIETVYKDEILADPIFTKRSSCAAGREGTNLDYDAEKNQFIVYGCSYSPASDLTENPLIRDPFIAGSFSPNNIDKFYDIWKDNDNWIIYRDLDLKSKPCLDCLYYQRNKCTGSCPIQNIDYSKIDVEENVINQLKTQMKNTGEWYCYQNIL